MYVSQYDYAVGPPNPHNRALNSAEMWSDPVGNLVVNEMMADHTESRLAVVLDSERSRTLDRERMMVKEREKVIARRRADAERKRRIIAAPISWEE